MNPLKVDLLSSGRVMQRSGGTGKSPVSFFLSPFLVFGIFVLSFGFGRLTLSETASFALAELEDIPILGQMRHLISSPDRKLRGEADDRINILLLGMGGEGHEGPNLTDTIMVASIRPSQNQVALLSIPRDLIVPLPKFGWRKINSANAFGELEATGRGGEYTRTVFEGLVGLDIPYYVRIDFNGFKSVIDAVDGVDVYVERAFTDYTYPTADHGVQRVSFAKGWQHMDGETALRFARSRHGTNGEGSDFARAKRQQKVLTAIKDKMLSAQTFMNPSAVANSLAALQSNITTNMQVGEILRLARMAQRVDHFDIMHKIVDNGPGSPLVDSIVGGAYVLVPKNDDWDALRKIAADIFTIAEASPPPASPPPTETAPKNEGTARIEIQNGSGKSGQARTTATAVKSAGFEVVKIGNADSFDYRKTVIYDLTKGKKPAALARLKDTIGTADVPSRLPPSLSQAGRDNVDFVLIIGQN